MGKEFIVNTLEDMCDLMCNNITPNNLIERQKILDACQVICDADCPYSKKQRFVICGSCNLGTAIEMIEDMPGVENISENIFEDIKAEMKSCIGKYYRVNEITDKNGTTIVDLKPYDKGTIEQMIRIIDEYIGEEKEWQK